jgi:phospholipid/cholesterol/gamma-HCH transport system substrate-binding protein
MITRAQRVRLGIFVVVSTAILVGSIVVIAGLEVAGGRDWYTVRFTTSMSGLEPGASVKYNGVRVGTVDAIRINPQDVSEVVVTLKLDRGTPVKKDTRAVVNLAGITGLKFIELTGGTSASDMLAPGGEIQAGESLIDKLTGRAENIAEKAELALNQINKAISDDNRERVLRVVDHADLMILTARDTVEENRENVRVAIEHVRGIAEKLDVTVERIDREGTAALVAVRQMAEGLRDSVDRQQVSRIMTNIEKVSGSVRTAVDNADLPGIGTQLKAAVATAKKLIEDVDVTVLRSRETLYSSLAYLLEGLESFSEFARSIRENPSLLFNPPKERERELP